jgi:hypothetical protein
VNSTKVYSALACFARARRQRVSLSFKKLAGGDTLFSYTQRQLLVGELKIIGPKTAGP